MWFCGGSHRFRLMQTGLFSELVLIDTDRKKAEGEAMDLSHGRPFAHTMKIYAGSYADVGDCAVIIVTAGTSQKPGEPRTALVGRNVEILRSVLQEIAGQAFGGILLGGIESGGYSDLCGLEAFRVSEGAVIGSGTVLDTARFRYLLSEHLHVDSGSVHAMIIGEHGDSELAVWSGASVSGIEIHHFCEIRGFFDHEKQMKPHLPAGQG